MELGRRIKEYRTELGMNQEDLAEKMYVSRQTISNWENEKSYPDVHSLLMLGDLFNVSLDILVKGDIEVMKEKINQEDIHAFQSAGNILSVLIMIMIVSAIPLTKMAGIAGAAVWAVIAAGTIGYSFKVEKLKKQYDIHTYREIVAFMNGETLDDIEKAREHGKAGYQNLLMALAAAGIAVLVCVLIGWFLL